MKTILVEREHLQRVLAHLWFCQHQPFKVQNPARLLKTVGGDSFTQFGYSLTRDWNQRTKQQFKDGHMNCLEMDDGCTVSVPNVEDKGQTYLKVSWGKTGKAKIMYPRHDATSVLRSMMGLVWLQDVGLLEIEGQDMNVMQAIAVCSFSLARGCSNGRDGAPILFDMVLDGELGSPTCPTIKEEEKSDNQKLQDELRDQRLAMIQQAADEGELSPAQVEELTSEQMPSV